MRRVVRLVLVLLTFSAWLLGVSALVYAEDAAIVTNENFGVMLSVPQDWDLDARGEDAKVIASFSQQKTAGKLELLGTRIIRDEHALVMFDAFKEQLKANGFVTAVAAQELEFGERKGSLEEFDFTSSEVTIRVIAFCFVEKSVAYAAVAYVSRADRERVRESLEAMVLSLKAQSNS
ncbi:MAG: hypothetical protein ACOX8U_07150 [Bradymonadia bacterium]|jgi:hypothetical protein